MKFIKSIKREEGLISIDAVIGITVFMTCIIAIMMFSVFARMQSTMQYALGQTAKEISGYFYMLDKTGLTHFVSGKTEDAKDIDKTIDDVFSFASSADSGFKHGKQLLDSVSNYQSMDIQEVQDLAEVTSEDAKKFAGFATTFEKDIEVLSGDPVGQLKQVFSIFAKSMINKGMSYYVTPVVCRALMPRYLGGDRQKADAQLEAMGIENGLNGLDFSQSELLADGRSIKIVVMYRVNPENMTLGFIKLPGKQGIPVRQVACTSAWLNPDGEHTVKLSNINK